MIEKTTSGWINGFIGVTIFAGSLPATRVAVADFSPSFLTCARATIAALLGLALLLALQQPRPKLTDVPALIVTALGVVVGFPLLTALALQHITSAHSTVFLGMLPLCTAIFAVLRAGERPRPAFWLFSVVGAAFVVGYAAMGGIKASLQVDLLMRPIAGALAYYSQERFMEDIIAGRFETDDKARAAAASLPDSVSKNDIFIFLTISQVLTIPIGMRPEPAIKVRQKERLPARSPEALQRVLPARWLEDRQWVQ